MGSSSLSKDARVQSYFGLSADRWLLYMRSPCRDAAASARNGLPGADPALYKEPSPSLGPDGWPWQTDPRRLLAYLFSCVCQRQTCCAALSLSDVVLAADGVLEPEGIIELAVMKGRGEKDRQAQV